MRIYIYIYIQYTYIPISVYTYNIHIIYMCVWFEIAILCECLFRIILCKYDVILSKTQYCKEKCFLCIDMCFTLVCVYIIYTTAIHTIQHNNNTHVVRRTRWIVIVITSWWHISIEMKFDLNPATWSKCVYAVFTATVLYWITLFPRLVWGFVMHVSSPRFTLYSVCCTTCNLYAV